MKLWLLKETMDADEDVDVVGDVVQCLLLITPKITLHLVLKQVV